MQREMREIMWEGAGIERTTTGLHEASTRLSALRAAARDLETAWETLDAILAELLSAGTPQLSTNTTLSPAPTATPTS